MFTTFFLLLLYLRCIAGLNILHYALGLSYSHLIFDYRLANESVSSGHNVTIWTAIATTLDISDSVKLNPDIKEYLFDMKETEAVQGFADFMDLTWEENDPGTLRGVMLAFYKLFADACKYQMEHSKDVIKELRNQKFDVMVAPGFDACPLIIGNLIGIPPDKVIFNNPVSALPDQPARFMNIPTNPSYIPHCLSPHGDSMTFFERVVNLAMVMYFYFPKNSLGVGDEIELFEELSSKNRPLTELISSVTSFSISGELIMNFPRPFHPGIAYLPEIRSGNVRKPTKLDPVFEKMLQKNNKGVIVVSFGTVTDTHKMPSNIKYGLFEALKQFTNYSVIWKFDQNDLPEIGNYPHIHTFSWIPQRALIKHDRVKVFATHCGFNSLLESVKSGIPMVLCPLFVDQMANAGRALNHGLGVMVDVKAKEFSSEIFASKIRTILNDKSYATRAKRFAAILGDKMLTAEQELNNRIEQVAKFGGKLPTLRMAQKLNLFEQLCLDILCYYSLCVLLSVIIVTGN